MKLKAVGFDLAKAVFQVHGVDEQDRAVLGRQLKRSQVLGFFTRLEPCLVGMEACGSAHYWARKLTALGHTVRLIAPKYVKAYVKTNKNDARDAEAICEALLRPSMRFVAVKSDEQQALLALHRLRQGLIDSRTALVNQLRGLLGEFGVVVAEGRRRFEQALPRLIAENSAQVPALLREALEPMRLQLLGLNEQIAQLDGRIGAWHRQSEASQRVAKIPGVGSLTASAAVATAGDPHVFDNGRGFAAWLGMVPGQHSTGGKPRLLGITKRGDSYLRKLFIHGARSVVRTHRPGTDPWLDGLLARRPKNVAVVALAHRNARIVWALLASGERYRPRAA
ncbi:MAG TPA: IS110 family transposase [Burkholderiales bacterium]|jgi:transposase|nr:IS110 family transposase [Burkholderiales bacterium]